MTPKSQSDSSKNSADDVLQLIARGEGQRIDFKEEAIRPSRLAQTLVSLANAEGGTIIIGVDDKGQIVGVRDLERAINNVVEAIQNCSPPLGIGLPQAVEMGAGVAVLVVEIPSRLPRVYHTHGRYLRRAGSMNMALDEVALRRLLFERGEISYEAEPVPQATTADIDLEALARFRQRHAEIYGRSLTLPDKDLLLAMGCLSKDGPPTVAGLLLFGKDIRRFFFEPHISIARYRGRSVGAEYRLDSRDFYGSIVEAAIAAGDYVNEHIQIFSRLINGKMVREDVPQYPRFAIREIIINAIVHRDWAIKGSRVLIKMFSDRIEVQSPGPFPPPVTAENIREEHQLRNPRIAQAFKDYGLIEKFGNGIDRVFEEIAKHPLKPRLPTFRDTGASVIVTLYGAEPPQERPTSGRDGSLTDRQRKIMSYLSGHGRISSRECQQLLRTSRATAKRDLAKLIAEGAIRQVGRGRGTYYTPV